MRRLIPFILLLLTTTAFAQSPGAVRLSGFGLENPNSYYARDQRSYGGEIEYFSSKNLSVALAVSSEPTIVTRFFDVPSVGSLPATSFERIQPIDALLRYHFANGSRIQPWLGAGPRYIRVAGTNNWREVLDGGLTIALTRHLGIDLEAKRLYGQSKPTILEVSQSIVARNGDFVEGSKRRLAAGLSWTF